MVLTFEYLKIKQKPTATKKLEFSAQCHVDGKPAFYVLDDGKKPRYFFPCNGEEGEKLYVKALLELDVKKLIDEAVEAKLKEKKPKKVKA